MSSGDDWVGRRSVLERRPRWRTEFLERVLLPAEVAGLNPAAPTYSADVVKVDALVRELMLVGATGGGEAFHIRFKRVDDAARRVKLIGWQLLNERE